MRTFIFVILFTLQGTKCLAQEAFDELPVNTQGAIGQNITLNCALSDGTFSLLWRNPEGIYVYEKGTGILPGFEGQYVVEEYGNIYNLVVLDAAEDDAGQYDCYCATMSSSALAEIILLASEPGLTCTETTSNDDNDFGNMVVGEQVTLTCQTTFYGLWGPTQIWFDSRGQILSPSDVSVGNIIEYINTKKPSIDRNISGDSPATDNGLRWIVDSYFPPPPDGAIPDDVTTPPTAYYSRSAPTWNSVYESTTIIVYYPVTNMNLDNVKHVYNPGEVITCTAEGNPEPEIRWVDDESGDEVADSGILVINAFMEGTQTYSCLATNVVRVSDTTTTEIQHDRLFQRKGDDKN